MVKLLIWGTGVIYDNILVNIKYFEMKNEIVVVGITGNESVYEQLDGYKFYPKNQIKNLEFDLIVVASCAIKEISLEILNMEISEEKIVDYRILNIYNMNFQNYIDLKNSKLSIIANNCWGVITYHYLKLPFLSPFINMFVMENDYIKLLKDIESYMEYPLKFYKNNFNENGESYPICLLGDVMLHMNHYKNFEEASAKWKQRKKRINWKNLFIMIYTENEEILEEFDKLPFDKKVCFVPFKSEVKCAVFVDIKNSSEFKNKEFWEIIVQLANGYHKIYDIWKLVDGKINYDRLI